MAFAPGDHEIYNFERPFIVYHYYMLNLSDQYPGVQKKIFKKKKCIVIIQVIWPRPNTRIPAPGS